MLESVLSMMGERNLSYGSSFKCDISVPDSEICHGDN